MNVSGRLLTVLLIKIQLAALAGVACAQHAGNQNAMIDTNDMTQWQASIDQFDRQTVTQLLKAIEGSGAGLARSPNYEERLTCMRPEHSHPEVPAGSLRCGDCQRMADPLDWRCQSCGHPLEHVDLPPFDQQAIDTSDWTLWRYADMLPVAPSISLGEGCTPLLPVQLADQRFFAKLEFLAPTGSYKDRGTVIVVNHLLRHGVREIVEDSSGNAGASLAAYAAAAGIRAKIFIPSHASTQKRQQIVQFGAHLVEIAGARSATTAACVEAAQSTVYASHAWSPFFLAGQMTCAWEIWEQLGRRAPAAVICPVGQGNLLLGLSRGFDALSSAGLIDTCPRLFAVQSYGYDSIVRAWESGADEPADISPETTIAEGICVDRPIRGSEILSAIRKSQGAAFRVDDAAIIRAQSLLALRGLSVEPTSAVPIAGLHQVRNIVGPDATIVIPLTGSGLKASRGLT